MISKFVTRLQRKILTLKGDLYRITRVTQLQFATRRQKKSSNGTQLQFLP